MKNSKPIKLLSAILLTAVFAVGASVNAQSQPDKLENPSPVKTNALALISELERPANCQPDDTLCLAENIQAKLTAALAGLKAIVRVDEQREGIIADMQTRIDIRGKIIDDLKKVDANSQAIDTRGQEISAIWREQHSDDKRQIADLQHDLDSCRSNQKWIALTSGLGGGFIGYKIRGAGTFQNPFQSFLQQSSQPTFMMNMPPTQAEENLRRALKNLKQ